MNLLIHSVHYNIAVIMNVQSPHKWLSTLKSAMFGLSSSFPPLISEGGELVCESVGKADLLSDHFYRKQSSYARATLDKQSCVITPTFVYHD